MCENDKIKYLNDSFPRVCSCGISYNKENWKKLPYVGIWRTSKDHLGPEEYLEFRNCICCSTITVQIQLI